MLVVHSMGSHGGQQGLPFGYDPNGMHGIGLPDFMTPGPPPGPPLLNQLENQDLDSFFTDFETGITGGGSTGNDGSLTHFPNSIDHSQQWMMPPTLVASDTSLRPPTADEWQNLPISDFPFRNDLNMNQLAAPSGFDGNTQAHQFGTVHQYNNDNMLHQLHNAAQSMQPTYANGWHHTIPQQPVMQMQQHTSRPIMRFGTDQHFQPTGYSAPDGPFDPDAGPNLDWLEAHSSATTTQPNTRPSTQPSSPYMTKKRKLSDYVDEHRRNGYMPTTNGLLHNSKQTSSNTTLRNGKKPNAKQEYAMTASQPPTPVLGKPIKAIHEDIPPAEVDTDYEEDDDDDEENDEASQSRPQSSSSFAWPANKCKPAKNSKPLPPAKSARSRKKSTASNTPVRVKVKTGRTSTSGTPASRTPLTADQKKANHTNSEQRRRDATAKAYAELYDLVPELDEKGKQSTMKKLEIVVAKVATVKKRVAQLRTMLGVDVDNGPGGMTASDTHGGFDRPSSASTLSIGNFPTTDLRSWNQR